MTLCQCWRMVQCVRIKYIQFKYHFRGTFNQILLHLANILSPGAHEYPKLLLLFISLRLLSAGLLVLTGPETLFPGWWSVLKEGSLLWFSS